jgi:hypothetical protein
MQHTVSLESAQARRKRSALVAGLAAACVASAVTFTMLASHPSPTTTPATEASAKACPSMPPLVMYVFTETGGGTVRFREGDWVSQPITLTQEWQTVEFPGVRSQTEVLRQVGTIEGDATNIVTVGALSGHRFVFPEVHGVKPAYFNWRPYQAC